MNSMFHISQVWNRSCHTNTINTKYPAA